MGLYIGWMEIGWEIIGGVLVHFGAVYNENDYDDDW